ncbi:poly(A) RNA polymerase, mitochondrial-like [Ptychodera flava]|uniref:poly(A) RNA polymerase, mitochondrial-like n=1 Tax=Ptychodera flava TaxID=63121 RepID=UPI00396A02E6
MAALMRCRNRMPPVISHCRPWHNYDGRVYVTSIFEGSYRGLANVTTTGNAGQKKKKFSEMVNDNRDRAFRSLLVRLGDEGMDKGLLAYCSQHGKVKHSFTYDGQDRYAVVEYAEQNDVLELLKKAKPPRSQSKMPFRSRLLNFSGGDAGNVKTKKKRRTTSARNTGKDLQESFLRKLSNAESVDDQMLLLLREQAMPDEDVHLRFLICSLVEEAVDKIVPSCRVYPFGSSVNSFGKVGSDVDMYLEINSENGVVPRKTGRHQYQMLFDTKSAASERAATQQTLATMATYLEEFVPHCANVQKILNARCPIVKFYHQATGLQCDLSSNNRIATKSTELLYLYGNHDPRVRPLVFTIRHWARVNSITSGVPGPWITNFGLTLLVIYFLQTRAKPVVPTVNYLRDVSDEEDHLLVENVDCTIASDLNRLAPSQNEQSLEELLYEFFEFCAKFNFQKFALSLRHGEKFSKPESGNPLYIENPFETELNITRNVNYDHLQRFVTKTQEALWIIDKSESRVKDVKNMKNSTDIQPWGLANLLIAVGTSKRGLRSKSLLLNEYISPIFQSLDVTQSSAASSSAKDAANNNENANAQTAAATGHRTKATRSGHSDRDADVTSDNPNDGQMKLISKRKTLKLKSR